MLIKNKIIIDPFNFGLCKKKELDFSKQIPLLKLEFIYDI